ncbi:metabolite-proton symporter [Tamaricihabitans halophyticus]|uniref:Putative proline/betaine transporter n=1 Tax=Tamaricihabitans halophyticus TaxID=1262583 RepID=A0A4R2R236_9PSEU|nr:MFS transporter [Tamaricihabitans halophyticus]TCP53485.1 metabolite-proton symporter [Tamaricihabitans halophyticus]
MAKSSKKVALGSFVGTTIEWYDFFIYGIASALIFSELFFPSYDPLVGTLLSFATFGVAFVARPLGGIVFGHFGDRLGRKPMLVITLIVMGVSTGAIGLLPTYATIGIAAPLLLVLLRLIQGLSVGGEYGGAVLMSVEHAPKHRRGLYGSWVQAGSPAGQVIANTVFIIMSTSVSQEELFAWAWRVPFLFSFVLVIVGITIRLALDESPEFKRVERTKEVTSAPLLVIWRKYRKQVMLMMGAYISHGVTIYLGAVYSLNYGTETVGFSYTEMLTLVLICQAIVLVLIPIFAHISDRVGHKKVFMIGNVGMGVCAFPWFALLNTGNFAAAALGFVILFIPYSATYGTMAAFFSSVYETRVGYSGVSLGYQFGGVVGSAPAPLIAAALLANTGSSTAIGWYMVLMSIVSVLSTIWLKSVSSAASEPVERSAVAKD